MYILSAIAGICCKYFVCRQYHIGAHHIKVQFGSVLNSTSVNHLCHHYHPIKLHAKW